MRRPADHPEETREIMYRLAGLDPEPLARVRELCREHRRVDRRTRGSSQTLAALESEAEELAGTGRVDELTKALEALTGRKV